MVRLLIISVTFFFTAQAFSADCGYFRVVKGKVTYKKQSSKKFRKARINKKICQGDTVKTEVDSRAKIEMADKNELNISPSTELIIEVYEKNSKAVLNVLNGKVRSNVKQKYLDNEKSHYRVKTKSAVAGVRGTEFLASYDPISNQSKVVTFHGKVAVGHMNGSRFVAKVIVKPGHFTSNSPGKDPHPAQEIPPAEFAQIDSETNVDDSSRGVSNQPQPENDVKEKDQKENDNIDQQEPEQKEKKPNQQRKDGSAGKNKADGKNAGKGPRGGANPGGVAGDLKGDGLLGDGDPNGLVGEIDEDDYLNREDGQTRDVASDDMNLPMPELNPDMTMPANSVPTIPTMTNPIDTIATLPDRSVIDNALTNQKVKVIITPVLPY